MNHNDEEDPAPDWLNESYDDKHKEKVESQPLLGTGPLPANEDSNRSLDVGGGGMYGTVTSPPAAAAAAAAEDVPSWTKKTVFGSVSLPIKRREAPSDDFKDNIEDAGTANDDFGHRHREITVVMKPEKPARSCILSAFRFFEQSGMVCLGGLFIVVLIGLFAYPMAAYGLLTTTLRVYVTLTCLLFLMVEVNAPIPFLQQLRILQNYISRGFLYTFLGLIVMEESYVDTVKETVATDDVIALESDFQITWLPFFEELFAYAVFGFGCCYVVMGLICLKRVRDHHKDLEKLQWDRYHREMEEFRRNNR